MGMTPEQFFETFVQGNYCDCAKNPGCVRRAFNAAVSASHLADHYYEFFGRNDPSKVAAFKKIGDFVEHISSSTHGAFRDIRSISNAYKHLYTSTDPVKTAYSSVSSAGAIECIKFPESDGDVESVEDEVESDQHGVFKLKVIFRRKDGQRLDFLPALEAVMNYWSDIFYGSH